MRETNRRVGRTALGSTVWGALAALVTLASWGWAGPDSPGMLVPGERFDEVLVANEAPKTVGVGALAGSFLTISCAARGKANLDPHLEVLLPNGQVAQLAGLLTEKRRSAVVKKLPVLETGIYRITMNAVRGDSGFVRFSVKAKKHPTTWRESNTIEQQGGSASFTFDSVPGSALKLTAQSVGKPKWTPTVRVVAPSGDDVDLSTNVPGKASVWKGIRLTELGTYTVHVSGGTGRFKALAKVKPPKRKDRTVTFPDVEALPEISGMSPASLPNDGTRNLSLTGFGFDLGLRMDLFDGTQVQAFAAVATVETDGAMFRVDLRGVAPGSYDLRVNSQTGNRLVTGLKVLVTNAPPGLGEVFPFDVPSGTTDTLEIRGAGMDPGITVKATLVADGSDIPVTLVSHDAHDLAIVRLDNTAGKTGPVQFEVREPAGGVGTTALGVDLLGLRKAAQAIETLATQNGQESVYPVGSAYADSNGTAVAAMERTGGRGSWAQFNHLTGQVLHRVTPPTPAASNYIMEWFQVVWNSKDDTWALTWHQRENDNVSRALMSIRKGSDLSEEIAYVDLGQVTGRDGYIGRVDATANVDDGGWLITWAEHGATASTFKVLPVNADGRFEESDRRTLLGGPSNLVWSPTMARLRAGRYLVVTLGVDNTGLQYALRSQVLDSRGGPLEPQQVAGTSLLWSGLFESAIGVNPNDGTAVVVFTYSDEERYYRPGSLLFNTKGLVVGLPRVLDAYGELPRGSVHAVVWNPDRSEFVMSATRFGANPNVSVRRLTPTGAVKAAPIRLEFEGAWGYVYAGSTSGSLGLLRMNSADSTLPFDFDSDLFQVTAAPLR